jgi:hypothetical protein
MVCTREFALNRLPVGTRLFRRWFGRPPCGGRPHQSGPSSPVLQRSLRHVPTLGLVCLSFPVLTCGGSWESLPSLVRESSVRLAGSVPHFDD